MDGVSVHTFYLHHTYGIINMQLQIGVMYLIYIIEFDDLIKQAVKVIEERHYFQGWANWTHGGEAHNVREENGHHVITHGLHCLSCH